MNNITLLSPAKVNLTLEILGKRPDGYHDIRSIMQPVNIFDEIKIEINNNDDIFNIENLWPYFLTAPIFNDFQTFL